MSDTPRKGGMLSNVLGIIGFIILIIVILWGIIHLASLSGGWFNTFWGGKTDSSITVSAPTTIPSGSPANVSWKYSSNTKGSYAFLYQCDAGIQISAIATGQSFVAVPCGTAYTLGSATSSIVIVPISSATSSVSIPLSILFIPSESTAQAQGSATVTITPMKTPVVTPVKKPETVTPATPVATAPANLSVRIISLYVDQYGNGTAVFDVSNTGGAQSGSYYFTASLPTYQPYTYNSPAQVSLGGGSHIVSTLNFTQAMSGPFTVQISGGSDSYYGDNTATQYLTAQTNYNNNYYQNQYPQYQQYPIVY